MNEAKIIAEKIMAWFPCRLEYCERWCSEKEGSCCASKCMALGGKEGFNPLESDRSLALAKKAFVEKFKPESFEIRSILDTGYVRIFMKIHEEPVMSGWKGGYSPEKERKASVQCMIKAVSA